MSDRPPSAFSYPFQLFDDFWYKFVYYPTTSWERAFNPQFFFGSNTNDIEIERHVLSKVGSYGLQLGHIIDMLNVLVSRMPTDDLTPRERQIIDQFRELSRNVDEAVNEHRGRESQGITRSDIDNLVGELQSLQRTDRALYHQLVTHLRQALPPAAPAESAGE